MVRHCVICGGRIRTGRKYCKKHRYNHAEKVEKVEKITDEHHDEWIGLVVFGIIMAIFFSVAILLTKGLHQFLFFLLFIGGSAAGIFLFIKFIMDFDDFDDTLLGKGLCKLMEWTDTWKKPKLEQLVAILCTILALWFIGYFLIYLGFQGQGIRSLTIIGIWLLVEIIYHTGKWIYEEVSDLKIRFIVTGILSFMAFLWVISIGLDLSKSFIVWIIVAIVFFLISLPISTREFTV